MATVTLSSKGRLVIPKKIRKHLNVGTGDRIELVLLDSGEVVIQPLVSDIRALKGLMKQQRDKPISITEMNRAVKREAGHQTPPQKPTS